MAAPIRLYDGDGVEYAGTTLAASTVRYLYYSNAAYGAAICDAAIAELPTTSHPDKPGLLSRIDGVTPERKIQTNDEGEIAQGAIIRVRYVNPNLVTTFSPPNEDDPAYCQWSTSTVMEDVDVPIIQVFNRRVPVAGGGTDSEIEYENTSRKVLRPKSIARIVVNVGTFSIGDLDAINAQTGKIHTLSGGSEWVFNGCEHQHVGGDPPLHRLEYTWEARRAIAEIDAGVANILPVPAIGVNEDYLVNVDDNGNIEIVGFNPYDEGDVTALPGYGNFC